MPAKPLTQILAERWPAVAGSVALFLLLAILYTFFVSPTWEAETSVVFPVRSPSLLGATGISDSVSAVAALAGGPTPLKIYGGMLQSARAEDFVAGKIGMPRKDLQKLVRITDAPMQNTLTVNARSKDPEKAKRIVALYLQALSIINRSVTEPLLGDDSSVLGAQLDDQRKKLRKAEDILAAFQKSAQTAPSMLPLGSPTDARNVATPGDFQRRQRDLELQIARLDRSIEEIRSKAREASRNVQLPSQVPAVEKWRQRLAELQYEYEIRSLGQGPRSEEIQDLQRSIQTAKTQLAAEVSRAYQAIDSALYNPSPSEPSVVSLIVQRQGTGAELEAVARLARLAPDEAKTMTRLVRDVAIQAGIVQQLTAQYEVSRLQTARNPSRWQVLDEPYVLDEPTNKNYARNGILGVFAGLVMGAFIALVAESRARRIVRQ